MQCVYVKDERTQKRTLLTTGTDQVTWRREMQRQLKGSLGASASWGISPQRWDCRAIVDRQARRQTTGTAHWNSSMTDTNTCSFHFCFKTFLWEISNILSRSVVPFQLKYSRCYTYFEIEQVAMEVSSSDTYFSNRNIPLLYPVT